MIRPRSRRRGFALLLALVMSTLMAMSWARSAGRLVALVRFKEYLAAREGEPALNHHQDEPESLRLTALAYGLALLETGKPRLTDEVRYCKAVIHSTESDSDTTFELKFHSTDDLSWTIEVTEMTSCLAHPQAEHDSRDMPESFAGERD